MAALSSLFQRSTNRVHRSHEFWNDKRKGFATAAFMALLSLNLLFLADLSYLYGVVFKTGFRVHHFNVLMVDFDGGVIGQSVNGAYQQFQGNTFPTLVQHDVSEFPTEADVREAVCKGHFWGALYIHRDASSRLSAALAGGEAATSYNPADTITYIWNAARYPSFSQGYVQSNLVQLAGAAGTAYGKINGTGAAQSLNVTDAAAVQALLNPIQGVAAPIQRTEQGTRVFYNTVGVILPILINFFFVMALNGVTAQTQVTGRLPRLDNWVVRTVVSLVFTFIGGLITTAFTWEYKESWDVSGGQFGLTWMVMWLFMQVNYYVFDCITAFIPPAFLAFFVLTWIIINVSGAVAPFELTAGFYHWSYALPGKNLYDILTSIWSKGCANFNYRALPILFSWLVVMTVVSLFSTRRRCDDAMKGTEAERAKWERLLLKNDQGTRANTTVAPPASSDLEKGDEPSRRPSTAAQSSA